MSGANIQAMTHLATTATACFLIARQLVLRYGPISHIREARPEQAIQETII